MPTSYQLSKELKHTAVPTSSTPRKTTVYDVTVVASYWGIPPLVMAFGFAEMRPSRGMDLYLPDSRWIGDTFLRGVIVATAQVHKVALPCSSGFTHPFGVSVAETPRGMICSIPGCGNLVW